MKIKKVILAKLIPLHGKLSDEAQMPVDDMLCYDGAFQFENDPSLIAFPTLVSGAVSITDARWRKLGYEILRRPGMTHNFEANAAKWVSYRLVVAGETIRYTLEDVFKAASLRTLTETLEARYDAQTRTRS